MTVSRWEEREREKLDKSFMAASVFCGCMSKKLDSLFPSSFLHQLVGPSPFPSPQKSSFYAGEDRPGRKSIFLSFPSRSSCDGGGPGHPKRWVVQMETETENSHRGGNLNQPACLLYAPPREKDLKACIRVRNNPPSPCTCVCNHGA